jgi:hypothetical protein
VDPLVVENGRRGGFGLGRQRFRLGLRLCDGERLRLRLDNDPLRLWLHDGLRLALRGGRLHRDRLRLALRGPLHCNRLGLHNRRSLPPAAEEAGEEADLRCRLGLGERCGLSFGGEWLGLAASDRLGLGLGGGERLRLGGEWLGL